MTEPLFVVRDAGNVVVFDSRVAVIGCAAWAGTVPASTALVVTFPLFVGRTAMVFFCGSEAPLAAVDAALGYPRVTFASSPIARPVTVFML